MTITRSMVYSLAGSRRAFEEGSRICEKGQIQIQPAKSFWKDEIKVTAIVKNARETEKQVSLTIRSGKIVSSRCSCMHPESRMGGLCCHGIAAALRWIDYTAEQSVQSAEAVKPLLEAYGKLRTRQTVADFLQQHTPVEKLVHLQPVLSMQDGRLAFSFKIGSVKFYKVRDIAQLLDTYRKGVRQCYGKYLDFYHLPAAFDEDSQKMLSVLLEIDEKILYQNQLQRGSAKEAFYSRDGGYLIPDMASLDQLFLVYQDSLIEAEEHLAFSGYLSLAEGAPEVELALQYRDERNPKRGICLLFQMDFHIFYGKKHLYLLKDGVLWKTDEAYAENMRIFYRELQKTERASRSYERIPVSGEDMPGFISCVLPVLQKYLKVQNNGIDLSCYEDRMLKTRFIFDRQGDLEITLEMIHQYGEQSFNPILNQNVSIPWRDMAKEKEAALLAGRCFEHCYQDKGLLTTYHDEEKAVSLLAGGFAEYAKLGQVVLSEKLKKLRIRRAGAVEVDIQAESGWLELNIDMDGLSRKELLQVLNQYEEGRGHYRLKDGSCVLVKSSELSLIPELMNGFQMEASELLKEKVKVSSGRALYLQNMLKEHEVVSKHNLYYEKLLDVFAHHTYEDVFLPDGLKTVLREYQVQGYQWLFMLDSMGFGGILADDMGLGKTVQTIALIEKIYENAQENRPILIVCPSSLLYNWKHELERFAPDRCTVIIGESKARRRELIEHRRGAAVWITSYDLLRRDVELYEPVTFRLQILDEAQYIKNQGTQNARAVKKIKAVSRFALTGTPIENRISELWSIFDYIMPGFLYSYQRFRTGFEIPLQKEENHQVLKRLRELTAPFILRRLKKDVLSELPDKCETVLYPVLDGEQKRLYNAYALRFKKRLLQESEENLRRQRTQILAELTRLRQLCCAPSLVYETFQGENAKLEALMELLHSCLDSGHRILIFSQFAQMLGLIEARLCQEKIDCFLLTGETTKNHRQQMVERFEEGEKDVFLISLKAGGTGLNLTGADTVIHYDPWWNAAAQNQATDRVYRIGQTREVNVYRLIAAGTIEENILKLQEKKQNLADEILAGESIRLFELNREELLGLL